MSAYLYWVLGPGVIFQIEIYDSNLATAMQLEHW